MNFQKGWRKSYQGWRRLSVVILLAGAILSSLAVSPDLTQSVLLAQTAAQTNSNPDLHQALLDLTNPYTVMCVAAHPDDEDGTTLTILRRKHGVHTVSLFSTYGEGGQNAIGPELYEELGVIRAKETMRASEIQGSEPHFLGLTDFGFSKSAEEAFRFWIHHEALRHMVLKIRELRPDVIITNHDTTRGHGHHQATGQLIIEAFEAAADDKRFPEQLTQVKPWQAQRLFVRQPGAAAANPSAPTKLVAFDPNEVDPIRGTSFAEQALQGLQQHASQGPWPKSIVELLRSRRAENGKLPLIRYRLEREAPNGPRLPNGPSNLFDGLDATRSGVPKFDHKLLSDLTDPNAALETLVKWRQEIASAPLENELWRTRVGNAFARAAGVTISVSANKSLLVRNDKVTFTITLANSGSKPVHVSRLSFWGWGKEVVAEAPDQLLPETETTVLVEDKTPAVATYTVPQADHLYDGMLFGTQFRAMADVDVEGAKFEISAGLKIDVVPAIEILGVSPSPCVRTEETLGRCRELSLKLANHTGAPFRGTIKIQVDKVGQFPAVSRPLVMASGQTSDEALLTSNKIPRPADLRGLRRSRSAVITIHGPSDQIIAERSVQLVYSKAHVRPNLMVGYVPSFDQTIEQSLAALGVESKALTVNDIQSSDLSGYHTIILDNRAYEAHPGLVAANNRLLEFAQAGGTLIVFYHKTNEWNPDANKGRPQLAPYPIILGDERVTDETAPVSFIQPRHPLLNIPNRISTADFNSWIQERGLYYPKEWDNQYAALFAVNDKGEAPLRGGLLVGAYGKGRYIYTSMVWYRQLRAGVPGAYRIFANMISYR